MNQTQYDKYISLCQKLYVSDEFMEWVALHTLKATIDKESKWQKLLTDSSNFKGQ